MNKETFALTRADRMVISVLLCVIVLCCVGLMLTSCSHEGELPEEEPANPEQWGPGILIEDPDTSDYVTIKFACMGDFSFAPFPSTRALTADDRDMTDLWVLDYMGDELLQTIHQTAAEDADFGQPTVSLLPGSHHLYFVASRGGSPTLDTDSHTLTWAQPSDTFYKDLALTVSPSSGSSRSVALDRCVTKLMLAVTDAIPDGGCKVTIAPSTWHTALDYLTGLPASDDAYTSTVTVPASYAGRTDITISIFGLSAVTEWQTDVTVSATTTGGTTLGSVTIADAPFRANRLTKYSGPLFSASNAMSVSLTSDWLDQYEATW